MSSRSEFARFIAELGSEDERALLAGADLASVTRMAVARDSERILAAIADEEADGAPTLRGFSMGFCSDALDDK